MSAAPIVSKVWSFCNTLRDDGVKDRAQESSPAGDGHQGAAILKSRPKS